MPERSWLMDQYKKMDREVESWPKWAQEEIEKQRAICNRIVCQARRRRIESLNKPEMQGPRCERG